MKLRHAAALALVGWYLMFPPIDPKSRFDPSVAVQQVDVNAPLRKWLIADTFDTRDKCDAALASMNLKPGDYWHGKIRCVGSDDPQIAGQKLSFVPQYNEPSK